ncbi:MAG TPA: PadR family transcriptional regulator [Galbitalea sp.]|jgi:DNA-binding PadR family transcriptional regulator|nr:PadR family transcriptional regulator [Galbitalea sp.]
MEQLSRVTGATIAVLTVLATRGEPCWGLAVIKASGRPAGSVYPILERLETAGWIASHWEDDTSRSGPRRRYYELTDEGALAARAAIVSFRPRDAVMKSAVTPRVVTP